MKYSIDRLDRIKELLHKRVGDLSRKQDSIRNECGLDYSYYDLPEYTKVSNAYHKCWEAIKKIDEKFNQAVEDFIAEEIEIE